MVESGLYLMILLLLSLVSFFWEWDHLVRQGVFLHQLLSIDYALNESQFDHALEEVWLNTILLKRLVYIAEACFHQDSALGVYIDQFHKMNSEVWSSSEVIQWWSWLMWRKSGNERESNNQQALETYASEEWTEFDSWFVDLFVSQ